MKIKRIAHLGIAVKDLDSAKIFYTDMLGLPVDHEEMVDELKTAFVPIGQTNMELITDSAQGACVVDDYVHAMVLTVDFPAYSFHRIVAGKIDGNAFRRSTGRPYLLRKRSEVLLIV